MTYKPYMNVSTGLWALDKGAGMVQLNLIDALVERLTNLFKDYELTAKSGLLQRVKVFAQYPPLPKEIEFADDEDDDAIELTEDTESESESESEKVTPAGYSPEEIESNFPCVIVKFMDMQDKEDGALDQTRINVAFLVAVYDKSSDAQGYRDVLNIIETVRQDLLSMPSRVLNKKYRLEMPFNSFLFDELEFPYFYGMIESVWETGRPLMPNFVR